MKGLGFRVQGLCGDILMDNGKEDGNYYLESRA